MSRMLFAGSFPRMVPALCLTAVLGAVALAGCGGGAITPPIDNPPIDNPPIDNPPIDNPPVDDRPVDVRLAEALSENGVTPIQPGADQPTAKVELGRMLFFDKIISGNRDISCSGCHHPTLASADGIPLSIGTGGHDLGPERKLGDGRGFVPRHATDVFNRALPEWDTFFWDLRLQGSPSAGFTSPEVGAMPAGLETVLAAQALVTVTNRTEMRGHSNDGAFGFNEMATIPDSNPEQIWGALVDRLLSFPGYVQLFSEAYPAKTLDQMTMVDAANAMSAFQQDAFTFVDSPFDKLVKGDYSALSADAKDGALLFYGKANCASCHTGSMMTDQEGHNIGVVQMGPGINGGLDYGLAAQTRDGKDLYTFRTPPLRNVSLTGPYMHNGSITTLEGAVRHHLNPQQALTNYDRSQLPDVLETTVRNDDATITDILSTLDASVARPTVLTDDEVKDLVKFLEALTDPAAMDLSDVEPVEVPSSIGTGYGDEGSGGGGGETPPGPGPDPGPHPEPGI